MLIGHQSARDSFLDACRRQRVHHAWLLGGRRGIGKRAFADWAARLLLAGEDGDRERTDALLTAGAHPDFRLLEPPEEGKGAATSSIIVEQVRGLQEFLHSHPAIAPWRVLLVDSIDAMNASTANAFLKELEEPGARTVYLLISHNPSRLLPTIRSRCRLLRLQPLSLAECEEVLAQLAPERPADERQALARLAAGAPGALASLQGVDVAGLDRALTGIAGGDSPLALVKGMQPQSALPQFQALLSMVPRRLASAARKSADPRLVALYFEASALQRDSIRLAYDRQQVAMALATILARAGQLQDRS